MSEFYRIIVIDDMRVPLKSTSDEIQVFLYKTPELALLALNTIHDSGGHVHELWLDHDMGLNYDTGDDITIMPVVLWLEEQAHNGTPLSVDYIFIHTSNGYRGSMMKIALERWYENVQLAELPVEQRGRGF